MNLNFLYQKNIYVCVIDYNFLFKQEKNLYEGLSKFLIPRNFLKKQFLKNK
jgi:hypothetical protein